MNKQILKSTDLGLVVLSKRLRSTLTTPKPELNFQFINKVSITKKGWAIHDNLKWCGTSKP